MSYVAVPRPDFLYEEVCLVKEQNNGYLSEVPVINYGAKYVKRFLQAIHASVKISVNHV